MGKDIGRFILDKDRSILAHSRFEKELEAVIKKQNRKKKEALYAELLYSLDILNLEKDALIQKSPKKYEKLSTVFDLCCIHHFKNPQLRIIYFYFSNEKIPILLHAFEEKNKHDYQHAIEVSAERKRKFLNETRRRDL